jgi:hypothetical protein
MIEWAFILTPLLVLPIVLLFHFVGCAKIAGLGDSEPAPPPELPKPKVPKYRDYIMGKPNNPGSVLHPNVKPDAADIIAYWRLVDTATSIDAFDEKGLRDGKYRTSTDPDTIPGDFIYNLPSLIYSDPTVPSRFFNGGYVVVPADDQFYTDEFTIEAWVLPGFAGGSEHTLFHAGGHYLRPFDQAAAYHGFRIYATDTRRWQVFLAPGGDIFPSPPIIPPGDTLTHLAVTVQNASPGGGSKTVTIFIDGKQTVQQTVGFSYSRPDGAPLLIGVQGEQSEPSDLATLAQPNVNQPMRSRIQEVVLHRKVLSQEEIENHVDINR